MAVMGVVPEAPTFRRVFMFDLVLCYHYLEIFNNFLNKGPSI